MSANEETVLLESESTKPSDSDDSSKWWGWIRGMLYFMCGLLVVTALLPLLPVDWWWVRIGDFPRLQLLCAYVVALLILAPFWQWNLAKCLAGLLVISIGIQLYWIFPYLMIAPQEVQRAKADHPDKRIRVLSANVLQENRDAASLIELIHQEQPDVVVLLEVNQRWADDLRPLKDQFAYQLLHPLENKYGIAFYTNLKVKSAEIHGIVRAEIPSIDVTVNLPSGHPVRIFAVHPNPPRPGEDTTKRDAELVLVGREVRNDPTVIVMGDLNDVGWSRTTNLFQEVSGLLDPRKGRGLYPTFNAKSRIWRYPLDYLFHSDDFRLVELRTLPNIGSDHFPLLVELSHEPDAEGSQEGPELDAGDREDAQEAVEAVERSSE